MSTTSAIPAATLILVREGPGVGSPPEFLMVERAAAMAFAAGAMVFPGGRIDPQDHKLAATLGVANGAAIVAAVRETIEETGIPVALSPLPGADLALLLQRDLLADVPLADLLDGHALALHPSELTLFAHWVPPLELARRFDTLFFIAAAPAGDWRPNVGERENRSAEWISAAETLRRDSAAEASLIFPTRCTLLRLAQHAGLAEMLDDARRHPVEAITPWIEECDGARMLTIPRHLGFPVTQQRFDGLRRG